MSPEASPRRITLSGAAVGGRIQLMRRELPGGRRCKRGRAEPLPPGHSLAAVTLAAPVTASAKGWNTLGTPTNGVEAGEGWNAVLRYWGHGVTRLPRRPELVFTHLDAGVQQRFYAEPTDERGVFHVRVSLPRSGTWTVYVYAREIGYISLDPTSRRLVVRASERESRAGRQGWTSALTLLAGALGLVVVSSRWFLRSPHPRT